MATRLILGATSKIAHEVAKHFAARGDTLYLIARNPDKLNQVAGDLRDRGASVVTAIADLNEFNRHKSLINEVFTTFPQLDTVLIAHGSYGNQLRSESDFRIAEQEIHTNYLSAVSLLTTLANRLSAQGSGTIAVITSVAGDRGLRYNYIYASAKAALTTYLEGLRKRLYREGVHVLTIKPGYVDTPMTAERNKNPLFASAERVGKGIYKAIQRKKNSIYVPKFWWLIAKSAKLIPEGIFKRIR